MLRHEEVRFKTISVLIERKIDIKPSELDDMLKTVENDYDGHRLLKLAFENLNIPVFRGLLIRGVDPNVLTQAGLVFVTLFQESLTRLRKLRDEDPHKKEFLLTQQIAQLLWIHKGKTQFSDNAENSVEELLDLSNPAYRLCYAAHTALQIPGRDGTEMGRILLTKMLKTVALNRSEVLGLVIIELKRTEQGYYLGTKAPISLASNHFQVDFLREICRDHPLLELLGIDPATTLNFDTNRKLRETLREQIICELDREFCNANAVFTDSSEDEAILDDTQNPH